MSYQNVGTPRFYINMVEWLMSIGMDTNINMNANPTSVFNTLPVTPTNIWAGMDASGSNKLPISLSSKSFIAVLGHNMKTQGSYYKMRDVGDNPVEWDSVVNGRGYDFNGFSIDTIGMDGMDQFILRIYQANGTVGGSADIGSLIIGNFYDMPHSPDLKLTMSREYGGIKTIETKGGSTLSNSYYTKPPKWGDLGAWELSDAGWKAMSRSGRRIWDLSFSYLADSDIFPKHSLLGNFETSDTGTGDPAGTGGTIVKSDDFYSQVIHRTMGAGNLSFIFQPDSSNNNPDQFAICKFDMKNF